MFVSCTHSLVLHCNLPTVVYFSNARRLGPFPEGLIMHSYLGSAEMVPELAKLGCYFSFSGFLSSMSLQKAKKMIRSVSQSILYLALSCLHNEQFIFHITCF